MEKSIFVCVKPVPSSDQVTIDPVTKTVRRSAAASVIGTLDKHALALAAQLKGPMDATVTVLTMAPATAEPCVREALARGGDRAVLLSDRAFAGGDTFATSHVLASAIQELGGADLILTGAASDDGGTGQLAAQLAEWLGMVHLHNAIRVTVDGDTLIADTLADATVCQWSCNLPAVVTVNRALNQVGPVSARNILQATRKELTVWSAQDLHHLCRGWVGLANSPTQNGELYPLDLTRSGSVLEDTPEILAQAILHQLAQAGITG